MSWCSTGPAGRQLAAQHPLVLEQRLSLRSAWHSRVRLTKLSLTCSHPLPHDLDQKAQPLPRVRLCALSTSTSAASHPLDPALGWPGPRGTFFTTGRSISSLAERGKTDDATTCGGELSACHADMWAEFEPLSRPRKTVPTQACAVVAARTCIRAGPPEAEGTVKFQETDGFC
jgi:hypothetical protein